MWRACGGCHAHLPVGHLVQWMRLLTTPALAQLGVTWPSSAVQKGEVTQKQRKPLKGLARPAGIEPATPAFGGQYSIH
nr:protein of unknown function [Ralstonia solanacearum]